MKYSKIFILGGKLLIYIIHYPHSIYLFLLSISKNLSLYCYLVDTCLLSIYQTIYRCILISLQPEVLDLRYFKLWTLLDQIVWNIRGLHHQVVKISGLENMILWQRPNSFVNKKTYNWKHLRFNLTCSLNFSLTWYTCLNI